MKMINIGFGSYVSADRIITVISPESAPVKRLIQESREKGLLIDASYGRSTKSVIITDCGSIILSATVPDMIAEKINEGENNDAKHQG